MLADGHFEVLAGLGSAAACADVLPGPVQDFVRHVIDAPLADGSGGGHQLGFSTVGSRAIWSRLAAVDPRHGKHLLAIESVVAAAARIGSASLQSSCASPNPTPAAAGPGQTNRARPVALHCRVWRRGPRGLAR
jgi:hypothetical protein